MLLPKVLSFCVIHIQQGETKDMFCFLFCFLLFTKHLSMRDMQSGEREMNVNLQEIKIGSGVFHFNCLPVPVRLKWMFSKWNCIRRSL